MLSGCKRSEFPRQPLQHCLGCWHQLLHLAVLHGTLVNGVATFTTTAIQAGNALTYATGDSNYSSGASPAISVLAKKAEFEWTNRISLDGALT